jgi:uncharacterized membrane protein
MSDESRQLEALKVEVMLLTERVDDLERALAERASTEAGHPHLFATPAPQAPPAAQPAPTAYPYRQPQAPAPQARPQTSAPPPQAAPPAPPRPVVPPPPPRPPFDWGKLAEQLFAARTLAWAGGVATVLGIILLFVMAASRGWITPSMRVGIGVVVSLGVLGAALEFDRRKWRSDAILAAAGVGIAGLYASLWAATSLYHLVASAAAAPLAGLIAAVAVAVALRIRQEPLALFGMSAAMLAPILVSEDVTTGGVLFSAVMLAAALPLFVRTGWRQLIISVWAIAVAETLALLGRSSEHIGFGGPVVAAAVMAALIVCLMFILELRKADRARLGALGSLTAGTAFTIALGATFLFGGVRELDGHSLSGITLAGLTIVWLVLAAVPTVVRRPHADLTDLLAGFGLTSAAIATGLLAGGPALVCAWTAESVLLVLFAERIRRRSATRNLRAIVTAAVYLFLGIMATVSVLQPLSETLPQIGAGSVGGSIALAAVALAGIVLCFGLRTFQQQELAAAWIVPALALGFLPVWALAAEQAVIAYAGMAAVLLVYRRTRLLVRWMPEWVGVVAAAGWWIAGAVVALVVTAPVDDLTEAWSRLGEQHGVAGLVALLASAAVFAWSVHRPVRPLVEYGVLAPVATLVYLVAQLLSVPTAIWAWLAMAGIIAGAVQVGVIRRRLGVSPMLVASGAVLAGATVAAWVYDDSLRAVVDHGTTTGWESIALATAAAMLFALAFPEPAHRTNALWLPLLLASQLSAMLLSGQYPLVAVAGLSAIASAAVLAWPKVLDSRLDREALAALAALSAVAVATIVLVAYETPRMLFETSHTPAAGLAAATAAAAALILAALAARTASWRVGRVSVAGLLIYAGGAFCLWTLAAAILGAEQLVADAGIYASVHDHFQQGHVLVSISWVMVGLTLVILSLRGDHRSLRIGGITLLFVALAKLFLYDLTFLTAMARAISFIVTGSVLLLAALLLQRFAPQVKAALGDEPPEALA